MGERLRDRAGSNDGVRPPDRDLGHRDEAPEQWAGPFRDALALHGRSGARAKLYFVWARGFSGFLSGKPLRLATREDAEGYLAKLSSSNRLERWQVEQAADALKILLGIVFGQGWTRGLRLPDRPGLAVKSPEDG